MPQPLRVLILEDDPKDAELVVRELRRAGFEPDWRRVDTEKDYLANLNGGFDIILSDYAMPEFDGMRALELLKQRGLDIPFVIVSGRIGEDVAVQAMRNGAADYLLKDRIARLGPAVDHVLKQERLREEKQTAQQALLDSEQRFRKLNECSPLGIMLLDDDGQCTYCNPRGLDIFGTTLGECLGMGWACVTQPSDMESVIKDWRAALREGREFSCVFGLRSPQQDVRWVSARSSPISCEVSRAQGHVATIEEITERRQAEEALEQTRQNQIRFKDEFLSHVSHELRSPLTAIKQFTTILLGGMAGELNKEQREYQQIVLKNIRQLQSMIDDLLEVTRLETGKLTIEAQSASVSDVVFDTLNTLQGTARAKKITLSCDLPPDLPSAHADHIRFRQILINLLDNAIKFTPDGGAVRVQARLLQQDPRFLLLEVSDTGCGINPEIADKIFQRLYQVSEPTQASRKGLGLGLYICKELVTRQGGQIWVKSGPQKGSTFSFTLPVVSLNNLIGPLLKNGKWPMESVALIMVESSLLDAWPSKESQEAWSHGARSLLQRCLLPDLDVLLPTMISSAKGECFVVAAFANEKGASVLTNRIRDQFERVLHLKQTGLAVSVSYSMLQPYPRDVGASMESIVTSMATNLEESIKSHIISEAVYHE